MKKKVGIIKRYLSILLIFLLSINSFAAIVSDNDGSAFITKAEFDALKSSFQAQIDTYNQSIDSKIDGAIASYLSGIKVAKEQTLPSLYEKYYISGYGTNYPLVWSSRTNKETMSPFNERLGYTERFEMPINLTSWLGYGVKADSIANQDALFSNMYKGNFVVNDLLPTRLDTYIKEDGVITRVCDIVGVINMYYVMSQGGVLTCTTDGETGWVRVQTGRTAFYNELYTIDNVPIWTLRPGGGKLILPNGVQMDSSGDPLYTGWFRTDTYISWEQWASSSVPVLQPFATHNVNCIIPDVSTLTGYNNSEGVAAKVIEIGARESYDTVKNLSSYWTNNLNTRMNWHIRATISLNQLYRDGFSVPQANPSTFIFKDFTIVEPKNGAIKNGVALCDIPKNGKIKIEFTPTETGEIYLWQAMSSTDNWGGKKPGASLPTSATMGYDINVVKDTPAIKEFEVKKDDGLLWVLYRPLGTTNEGQLNNFNITLTEED